jgi:hypothetical protein
VIPARLVRTVPYHSVSEVMFECQPQLTPLMRGMREISEVVPVGSSLPAFDAQAPLGSLPRIFGTTANSVPAAVPYLRVPKKSQERREEGRTAAIGWPGDWNVLERLLEVPGIRFVKLEGTGNLADAASGIANADVVITADGALAHLAGAMGAPVWTLVPFAPDWPWMLGRDDSPWYPTMRLFRQPRAGDWAPVIDRVREALLS